MPAIRRLRFAFSSTRVWNLGPGWTSLKQFHYLRTSFVGLKWPFRNSPKVPVVMRYAYEVPARSLARAGEVLFRLRLQLRSCVTKTR